LPDTARRILWADDEIDLLRPHILFLEGRGYKVSPVSNGEDAVSLMERERFDIVLLDEMMPGIGGLETLARIKTINPAVPVILITKSEEESLMNEAIGKRITDYLIKPVNPSQIFAACKRVFEAQGLQRGQVARDYVREFQRISALRAGPLGWKDWAELYQRLSQWDLDLQEVGDTGLEQTQADQMQEINIEFGRFIETSYSDWVHGRAERPVLSTDLIGQFVAPLLREKKRVYLIVIDCMRLDQWMSLEPLLEPYYQIERPLYCSILPTATPYSRNALFAGLFPADIAKRYPQYWQEGVNTEGSRNRFERPLLENQLRDLKLPDLAIKYVKVYTAEDSNQVRRDIAGYQGLNLTAFVFNFLDILAHGRSESDILQELAPDEAAFRSVLGSWFQHSPLFEILKGIARQDATVVVTTDHGAILARRSALVYGDRETSTNLRYKYGKNLTCDSKQAVVVKNPLTFRLPNGGVNKNYILAREDYYFVYPTRFHEYERQYRGSFQHGGISMEEMILPCAILTPRR
jgi:CheY-like chemotaxis protein